MLNKIKLLKNRIYADYFMPSRLEEYERIIKEALKEKYIFITLKEYIKKLECNQLDNKRYFLNRHDIDTDIATAKEFFKIEKKYNVKATYYFRLSTLDIDLMKEIEEYGSEASYHFEEIATYCKENHIKSRDEVLKSMGNIKELFKKNYRNIENKLGYKLETVCAHGDFVNRKLNIINNELTNDKSLREKLGILCETYDENIMHSFDVYVRERSHPIFYYPQSIFEYVGKVNRIYMLTHPRQWKSNVVVNTIENIKRIYEEILW